MGPESPLFTSDAVVEIAKNSGRSPAQVLLRWGLQHGFTVLPKSTNPEHIRQNFNLQFSLSEDDMTRLDKLEEENGSKKYAWDPSTVL